MSHVLNNQNSCTWNPEACRLTLVASGIHSQCTRLHESSWPSCSGACRLSLVACGLSLVACCSSPSFLWFIVPATICRKVFVIIWMSKYKCQLSFLLSLFDCFNHSKNSWQSFIYQAGRLSWSSRNHGNRSPRFIFLFFISVYRKLYF
jgi:hypothetical protein